MPLYEFICGNGHITEQLGRYDLEIIDCPECEERAVRMIGRKTNFTMNPEDRGGHA
jgi:hypothetical protein